MLKSGAFYGAGLVLWAVLPHGVPYTLLLGELG